MINAPGRYPAAKRRKTDSPAVNAQMIMMMLGGMIIPRIDAAVTSPTEKSLGYLYRSILGNNTPPMVTTVEMADPLMAPKTPEDMTEVMPRPPGSQDTIFQANCTNRLAD